MLRKALVLVAALACLLALPVAADARTRSVNGTTVRLAIVGTADGANVFAGTVRGPWLRGAGEVLSRPAGENRFASTGTIYDGKGTIRVAFTNTVTPQPDGSATFAGEGRFTGGTRRYRGARGRFTFSATSAANENFIVARFSGTIRY